MEPLQIKNQIEAGSSKVEKDEKIDALPSKKKRALAARHMQQIRSERRNEVKRASDTNSVETPINSTSLVELFESKSKKSDENKTEPKEVDQNQLPGHLEKQDQADLATAVQVIAETKRQELSDTPGEVGDVEVDQLYAAVEEGLSIDEAANAVEQNMGATNEDIEAAEAEFPSHPVAEYEAENNDFEMPIETYEPSEFAADPADIEGKSELSPEAAVENGLSNSNEFITNPTIAETWARRPDEAELQLNSITSKSPDIKNEEQAYLPPAGGANTPPPLDRRPNFYAYSDGPSDAYNINPDDSKPRFIQSGNLNAPGSNEIYDAGNPAVTALLGYLIGRRRGRRKGIKMERKERIKSERKLQKQIENIDWQLNAKEQQVRKLARDKQEQLLNGSSIKPIAKTETQSNLERLVKPILATPDILPKPSEPMIKQSIERRPAAEARKLHGSAKASERIGQMLIGAAELPLAAVINPLAEISPLKNKPEQIVNINKTINQKLSKQAVERQASTLSRQELLDISQKIVVDGTSLRQIYETHLIGERGLRRLVAEHVQGGDVKKILRQEIVEHEIDFERDPAMRDAGANDDNTSGSTSDKTNFDDLVRVASANLGDTNPQAAYYKARAKYEAEERRQANGRSRTVDVTMGATITILFIAVILLLLSGR